MKQDKEVSGNKTRIITAIIGGTCSVIAAIITAVVGYLGGVSNGEKVVIREISSETGTETKTAEGLVSWIQEVLEENQELSTQVEELKGELEEKRISSNNTNIESAQDSSEKSDGNSFVELVYDGINHAIIGSDENSGSVTVGGKDYYSGVTLYGGWDGSMNEGSALVNLGGDYSTMSFDIGRVDNELINEAKLVIYFDGESIPEKTFDINPNIPLTHITFDVTGIQTLKLQVQTGLTTYAIVNCEIS